MLIIYIYISIVSCAGCFLKVYINNKQVDLLSAHERYKVIPGCDSVSQDPCHNNLCQKGKCKPRRRKPGYRCKCNRGYSGTYCDRGGSSLSAGVSCVCFNYLAVWELYINLSTLYCVR